MSASVPWVRPSVLTSLVVGTVLSLANQWRSLVGGPHNPRLILQLAVNFGVPFLVAAYSRWSAMRTARSPSRRVTRALVLACAALGVSATTTVGATTTTTTTTHPSPYPDDQSVSSPHATYHSLLRANVRGGLVDYDAFARAPAFAGYLDALAHTNPDTLPRSGQLAFWINAYNAYTIAQVNAHGERRSIRNIDRRFGVGPSGAWSEAMAAVGGHRYTLDQIEHERIRPVFHEPRVHFALVCAALGCPPLRSEAYDGAMLDAQLDDQARRFIAASPTKNRVDRATGTVWLSPIFRWYGDDFAQNTAGILRYVAQYVASDDDRVFLRSGTATVKWTAYDWNLNLLQR